MSIAGIVSSSLFGSSAPVAQNTLQQMQSEFQQLGLDLQSGNLSAAQNDFTSLQQNAPASSATGAVQASMSLELSQLGQALQSGNLQAAQQDYSSLQTTAHNQSAPTHGHHHHHGGGGGSELSQLMNALGGDLQSGNLSAAQQAYTTLQQDFPALGAANTSAAAPSSALSLLA